MAKIIDANIIIRYLVGDSPSQIARFKKLIKESKEKLILTDVTVAEIVWVLESHYEQEREAIADKILSLLDLPVILSNKSLITRAIYYYRDYNLDYIDAHLIAYALEHGASGVLSYDKSIDRVREVKRFEL